jgi:hypothetical protein
MSKASDIRELVARTLAAEGVDDVRFGVRGSGHQYASFRVGGKACTYVFPNSPKGGVRSHQNCRAGVRRMCREAKRNALPYNVRVAEALGVPVTMDDF